MKYSNNQTAGFDQLKRDLNAKNLSNFYILYGEEDYLRNYYLEQIKNQLLDDFSSDFNLYQFNTESFSLQSFYDSIEALPMMADRTLVLVEDVDFFSLAEDERTKLTEIFSEIPKETCLVCSYLEFSPDKRKKPLWDAISQNAVLTEFTYQSESDLRAWLQRHFRANKKYVSPDLCSYLLLQCGLSMTRLHGEVEKICAYSAADNIVKEDIDAVVEPTLEAVAFDISDAIANRNFDLALNKLRILQKMKAEPIPTLAAIGSQMRRLNSAKILDTEGKNFQDLMDLYSMGEYQAKKVFATSKKLSDKFTKFAVLKCYECDCLLKTSMADGDELLELFVLQLAEVARND